MLEQNTESPVSTESPDEQACMQDYREMNQTDLHYYRIHLRNGRNGWKMLLIKFFLLRKVPQLILKLLDSFCWNGHFIGRFKCTFSTFCHF
jgi:hypothetical protein